MTVHGNRGRGRRDEVKVVAETDVVGAEGESEDYNNFDSSRAYGAAVCCLVVKWNGTVPGKFRNGL